MAQTPRELTPYASLRHFFGAELRQWRLRADLSHDRLGAQRLTFPSGRSAGGYRLVRLLQ